MPRGLHKPTLTLQLRAADIRMTGQCTRLQVAPDDDVAALVGGVAAVGGDPAVHLDLPAIGQHMHGAALHAAGVDVA